MEEQLINYETAVLAEEKGFKESSSTAFLIKDDEVFESEWDGFGGWYSNKINDHIVFYDKKICRPTQALLQKWLREVHKIEVLIKADCSQLNFVYGYDFYVWNKNDSYEFWSTPDNCPTGESTYKTYEEALESGL
jgi:hypothetical protein